MFMLSTANIGSDANTSQLPLNIQQLYTQALAAEKDDNSEGLIEACKKIIEAVAVCSSEAKQAHKKAIGYAYFMLGRKHYSNEVTDPEAKRNFFNASIYGFVCADFYLYKIFQHAKSIEQTNARLKSIVTALQNKSEKLEFLSEKDKLDLLLTYWYVAKESNLAEKKKLISVIEHLSSLLCESERQACNFFSKQMESMLFENYQETNEDNYIISMIIINYFKAIISGDYYAIFSIKSFLTQSKKIVKQYQKDIFDKFNLLQFQLTNFSTKENSVYDLMISLIHALKKNFIAIGFTETEFLINSLMKHLVDYRKSSPKSADCIDEGVSIEALEEMTDILSDMSFSEGEIEAITQKVSSYKKDYENEDEPLLEIPSTPKQTVDSSIVAIKRKSQEVEAIVSTEDKIIVYKDIINKIDSLSFEKRLLCKDEFAKANYKLGKIYYDMMVSSKAGGEEILKKINHHLRVAGACGYGKALYMLVNRNPFLISEYTTNPQKIAEHYAYIDHLMSLTILIHENDNLAWLSNKNKLDLYYLYKKEKNQIQNKEIKEIFEYVATSLLINLIINHYPSSAPYYEMAKFLKSSKVECLSESNVSENINSTCMYYLAMIRGCSESLEALIKEHKKNTRLSSVLLNIKNAWLNGDKYTDALIILYFDCKQKLSRYSVDIALLLASLLEVLMTRTNFDFRPYSQKVYNLIEPLAVEVLQIEGNHEKYQGYLQRVKEAKNKYASLDSKGKKTNLVLRDDASYLYSKLVEAQTKNDINEMEKLHSSLIAIYGHLGEGDNILGESEHILGISYYQKYEKEKQLDYFNKAKSYLSYAYENGITIACFHLYKLFLFQYKACLNLPMQTKTQKKKNIENQEKWKKLAAEWGDKLLVSVKTHRKMYSTLGQSDLALILEVLISAIFQQPAEKDNLVTLIDLYCNLSQLLFVTNEHICYSLAKDLEQKNKNRPASEVSLAIPIFYFLSFLHGFNTALEPLIRYLLKFTDNKSSYKSDDKNIELLRDFIDEDLRLQQPIVTMLYANNKEKLQQTRDEVKKKFQSVLLPTLQQIIPDNIYTIAEKLLNLSLSPSITDIWKLEPQLSDISISVDTSYTDFDFGSEMQVKIDKWKERLPSNEVSSEDKQKEIEALLNEILVYPTDAYGVAKLVGDVTLAAGLYYFNKNENQAGRDLARKYFFKADQCGVLAAKFYLLKLFEFEEVKKVGQSLLVEKIKADYLLTFSDCYHGLKKDWRPLNSKNKYDLYVMMGEHNNFLQKEERAALLATRLTLIRAICRRHPTFSGPYYSYGLCLPGLAKTLYYFLDILYGGTSALRDLSVSLEEKNSNHKFTKLIHIVSQIKSKIDLGQLYDNEGILYIEDFCDEFEKCYALNKEEQGREFVSELRLGVANALIFVGTHDFALRLAARHLIKSEKPVSKGVRRDLIAELKCKNIDIKDKSLFENIGKNTRKQNEAVLSKMAAIAVAAKKFESNNEIEKLKTACEEIIQLSSVLSSIEKNNDDLQFAEYTLGVLHIQPFLNNKSKEYSKSHFYFTEAMAHGLIDALYWHIKLGDACLKYASTIPPDLDVDGKTIITARLKYLNELSSSLINGAALTYLSAEQKIDLANILLEQYSKEEPITEFSSNYKAALILYNLVYKKPGKSDYILAKNLEIFAKQSKQSDIMWSMVVANLFSSLCYGKKYAGLGLITCLNGYIKTKGLTEVIEKIKDILFLQCLYPPAHPKIVNKLAALTFLIKELISVHIAKDTFVVRLQVKLVNALLNLYPDNARDVSLSRNIQKIIDKIKFIEKNELRSRPLQLRFNQVLSKQADATLPEIKRVETLKTSSADKIKLAEINENINSLYRQIETVSDLNSKISLCTKLLLLNESLVQENYCPLTSEIRDNLQKIYLQLGKLNYEKYIKNKDESNLNLAKTYLNMAAYSGSINAIYILQKVASNRWQSSCNAIEFKRFKAQQYLLLISENIADLDTKLFEYADKNRELFAIYTQTKAHLKLDNPVYIQEKLLSFSNLLLQLLRENSILFPKPYYDLAKFYGAHTDNTQRDAKLFLFQMRMALNYCSSFFLGEIKGLMKLVDFYDKKITKIKEDKGKNDDNKGKYNKKREENNRKTNNPYNSLYRILSKIKAAVTLGNKIKSNEFYKIKNVKLYEELVSAFAQLMTKSNSKIIADLTYDIILSLVHQPLITTYTNYNWEALHYADKWLSKQIKLHTNGQSKRYLELQKIIEEKKIDQPQDEIKETKEVIDWDLEKAAAKKSKGKKNKSKSKKTRVKEGSISKVNPDPLTKEAFPQHKTAISDLQLASSQSKIKKELTLEEKRLLRKKNRQAKQRKKQIKKVEQKQFQAEFLNPTLIGKSLSEVVGVRVEAEHEEINTPKLMIDQSRSREVMIETESKQGEDTNVSKILVDQSQRPIKEVEAKSEPKAALHPYKKMIVEEFDEIVLEPDVAQLLIEFSNNVELVGGYVRDYILSRTKGYSFNPNDRDYVCGDAQPRIYYKNYHFKPTRKIGLFTDHTLHKNDMYYSRERIECGIEADAKVRDFTVNALYFKFIDGEFKLLDPNGHGYQDLLNGRLRLIKPFNEAFLDPRVIIRCFSMISRGYEADFALEGMQEFYLGFFDASKMTPDEVTHMLSKELINPLGLVRFDLYMKYGLLQTLFPEINKHQFAWVRKQIELTLYSGLSKAALFSYFIIAQFGSCLDKRLVYYVDPAIFNHDLYYIMAQMRLPEVRLPIPRNSAERTISDDIIQFNYDFIKGEVENYFHIRQYQIARMQMQRQPFPKQRNLSRFFQDEQQSQSNSHRRNAHFTPKRRTFN